MRNRLAGLAAVILALMSSAAPRAGQGPRTAAAQKLPPLSYVCIMPGDEDVIEDKPGSCPKCKMDLVPVRLDAKWWCPVHQANEVYDGPGKCRRDGRELVQVTVSETWTCADAPDKKLLEPGKCADGSARKIGYELRAHGDHNPRHGGQFYMASDAWHHIEGTYPQSGLFRVFFYDNFTKPYSAKGFVGSVVIRDAKDKEIGSAPLVLGKNGTTMDAQIPAANAALPLRATVKLKFDARTPEQPFDFQFNEFSKDTAPPGTTIGPTATPRPTAAPPAPKPAAAPTVAKATPPPAKAPTAPPPAAAAPAAAAPATAAAQESANAFQPPDLFAGEIAPMPPALAAVLNEETLPKSVPELVAELTTRSGQIDALMKEGNLSEVWLPAMGTKTVALVLEQHAGSLPPAKRAIVTTAVKGVVTSAWEIDGYGDVGNRTKIVEAYERLSKAVADLKAAYEGTR
jgi:hypothetical protein